MEGLPSGPMPQTWFAITAADRRTAIHTTAPASLPDPSWTYARDFLLTPVRAATLPADRNTNQSFAGWCEAPPNKPILVLAGKASATRLALRTPKAALPRSSLVDAFVRSLGDRQLCEEDGKTLTRLKHDDIHIVRDLLLPTGERLVALSLNRQLSECESELGGVEQPRWFLVRSEFRFIGASLELVAAVDLEADKQPEYVFWYSGYNEDGYLLFDAAFREAARFTWKYH